VPLPRNPAGTVVPASQLPVKGKKFASGLDPTLIPAIPDGANLDEEMLPHAAAHLASHNHLATRATKFESTESVVRPSEAPLLFGPVAAAAAAAHSGSSKAPSPGPGQLSSNRLKQGGSMMASASPAPSAGGMPPRPPSQQQQQGGHGPTRAPRADTAT